MWRNDGAERFLANRSFWSYVDEPQATREPWQFDPKKPELPFEALKELRNIALSLVTKLGFLSPPSLWHGNTPRKPWGLRLMNEGFEEWKEAQRRSGQISAAIFYPTEKRNYDFMLCVNKYVPLALTRIQDADVRSNKNKLESMCKTAGLQFDYTTERPILLPQEPKSCSLEAVKVFVEQLERFKSQVGCSIRELGEIPRIRLAHVCSWILTTFQNPKTNGISPDMGLLRSVFSKLNNTLGGLVEVGFEYVTGEYNDGGKLLRKRK